jgi:hypothetical protein
LAISRGRTLGLRYALRNKLTAISPFWSQIVQK